jgi:hypothetical protein
MFEEKSEQEASVKADGKQRHSTLKMEAAYSFEISIDFQRTTLPYVPE